MLPVVACICPTYGRAPQYQHLLEEAIESFLRQDYPVDRRSLLVLNDAPGQELVCDVPGVHVFNQADRIRTLGGKYNRAIALTMGKLILPWEDDDISLPWRISQAVEQLGAGDYWKPPQVWYCPKGQAPVWQHSVGVRHHASVFTRSAWERVGGYPLCSGAQDAGLDQLLNGGALPVFPQGLPPAAWAYIYRWGVSPVHLSGVAPHDDFYRQVGEMPIAAGRFELRPQWREDYVGLTRRALEQAA